MASTHRFRRVDGIRQIPSKPILELDTCWICEGWQEVKFEYVPGRSGQLQSEPLFIHLEVDNYRPILMTKLESGFIYYRVCPPNRRTQYFFSNPIEEVFTIAKD